MKVNVKQDVFLVHFETRKHESNGDELPQKELVNITCYIKHYHPDSPVREEISSGEARQHYNDKCNHVFGRKIAFTKALMKKFNKINRTIFWEKYKKENRYIVR